MISCLGPPILLLIETVCRYPVRALFTATRTATGLRRISTQQEMDSTRDANFGLVKPLSLWSGTQQDIASMTENHGVPGSNPGPATTPNRLFISYTSFVTPRGGAFLCVRVQPCAAGWLSTWLSDRSRSHTRRSLLRYRYPERS